MIQLIKSFCIFATSKYKATLNDNEEKSFQYAKKSIELNPDNIEDYEALGSFYFSYYYGEDDKFTKIRNLIKDVGNADLNPKDR